MIHILKASAGSGKTFNLARTYIRLLLESDDRYSYRHTLAVTFTNKATSEMKGRILKELHLLSKEPGRSAYLADLVPAVCPSEGELQRRAGRVQLDILHDYSAFAVSTIDRFFQRVLKAFAREIGYYASYQVELDRESLIQETVDRMLDSLTENDRALLGMLLDTVMEMLEDGRKPGLERQLMDMGLRLKSAEYASLAQSAGMDGLKAYSRESVSSLRKLCRSVMRSFTGSLASASREALSALGEAGISVEDSSRRCLAPLETWASLRPDERPKMPTEAFLAKCLSPESCFRKADASRIMSSVGPRFGEALGAIYALVEEQGRDYNTAALIYPVTDTLSLAGEFIKAFDALVREKNIMSIDDSNTILRRIIDGSDAPFVYEKTGVRYEHFLLDEFQDTSGVQWDNFRPLLAESDAYGRDNLVVGDVKQSIYRWRGSDWHLLSDRLPAQFPNSSVRSLDSNFRSLRTVVEFNNDFFTFLSSAMDRRYGLSGDGSISSIYSDVRQHPRVRETAPGQVRLEFCPQEEECGRVVSSVEDALAAGASYRDIAVLVRDHKGGGRVASALIASGIPVISDDSLLVKSSVSVRRLVSLLSCVDNPGDEVSGYLAAMMDLGQTGSSHSLVDLCEMLLRRMRAYDAGSLGSEVLYIQTFMDIVQDWSAVGGNNLHGFLEYWAGANPKIVSPEDSDSVTIMTIHKSKGLQFPYVIVPFAEGVGTAPVQNIHWCRPDIPQHSPLHEAASMIYPVNISTRLEGTWFSGSLRSEQVSMAVDDINLYYVAFTRAEKVLHVIAAEPGERAMSDIRSSNVSGYSNLSHYLCEYKMLHGDLFGEMYDFSTMKRQDSSFDRTFDVSWPSWPIVTGEDAGGDAPVGERSRLKFSSDAADFFGADGSAALDASPRLGGIIRHDILSRVDGLGQLRESVDRSVREGVLTGAEGDEVYASLRASMLSVSDRGWFVPEDGDVPDGEVSFRNEVSIIGTDGEVHRPDRVVIRHGVVTVIDYKFGHGASTAPGHRAYVRQVQRYMGLYRAMGYGRVEGYLWYVTDGEVIQVQ